MPERTRRQSATPPLFDDGDRVQRAREVLRHHAQRVVSDPQTNSVFLLAQDMFTALETGQAGLGEVRELIDDMHAITLEARAGRLRAQHFPEGPSAIWDGVRQRLKHAAAQGLEAFRQLTGTAHGGLVFTGHPTFSLSSELRAAIARHTTDWSGASRAVLKTAIAQESKAWALRITLRGEHAEAQAALAHARDALAAYAALVMDVAADAFPQDWRDLDPVLPSLASWVGYDLDGRTDIHWSQSLAFRLDEKAWALGFYRARLEEIATRHRAARKLAAPIDRLRHAEGRTLSEAAMFAADLTDPENLVAAANVLTAHDRDRLTDWGEIADALARLAREAATSDALARSLLVLRAQVMALGLGTARIHLRVNAAQVRTVLTRDLGLQTEAGELGRLALRELSRLATDTAVTPVNFADLFLEQSTARRQFLLCAQILKHVDERTPIRFLIAESENPATVMGALYLARQYGVADRLDISPLFETPEALEIGGRFIERLLEEDSFLAYLSGRGYLSVQFGFSDSGRFIGQIAGNMAIERIHNLIGRVLARRVPGIGLLIFNTHGESMGRGAWPGSFAERFDHLLTPWTREGLARRGQRVMHEMSFQGGDGFLHFATPELAEATMAAACAHFLDLPAPAERPDPFYTRTDFVWDFYRALRAWHERLFKSPDYGHALSDFAPGFVARAGSRQVRRPGGSAGPRSLRAISHNATLQQLGIPLNTAAGIGSAVRRETDRLVDLVNASPRMRALVLLAAQARILTSAPAVRGYAAVYDPGVWLALARIADPDAAAAARTVAASLSGYETSLAIRRLADTLAIDLAQFDALLVRLDDAPSAERRHEARLDIHVLHAIRQALMMRALSLVGRLPDISPRHDLSKDDILAMVKAMRLDEAVACLRDVFPLSHAHESALSRLTEPGHLDADPETHGYRRVHEAYTEPLAQIAEAIHDIGLAISHAYGAHG